MRDESTFNKSRVVEATRSVRVAGLDEDDSGANGSEAATAEGDETGIEGADISADDDEKQTMNLRLDERESLRRGDKALEALG